MLKDSHGTPYPLTVEASLDPRLTRWMWLVKWLLAIPHYVVLAFLWVGFFVVTVIAFFAILFTGRYPRPLFDFNLGVLRWSARVHYYALTVAGTDRYPPFTLEDVPDYPFHLDLPHPDRLSRGLVLVKWWLLAIPHYVLVDLFVGSGWYGSGDEWNEAHYGFSLVGALTLIAVVALLFTAVYPRRLYDFLMGLVRWILRVAVYASLMTDRYPPFALDQGGEEPAAPAPGA
ncbi:DUF4389 domain-containing protein [Streptomyces sp. bgisy060]|uniref:DUF4389 domain-containing protein n=1 Tax=Streptomyces sp. bgisy060 TaxID=3413775 RepID=UPI003EBDE598